MTQVYAHAHTHTHREWRERIPLRLLLLKQETFTSVPSHQPPSLSLSQLCTITEGGIQVKLCEITVTAHANSPQPTHNGTCQSERLSSSFCIGLTMCLMKTNLRLGAIRILKQLCLRLFDSSPISHLANRSPWAFVLAHSVSCATACVWMSCNLHVYANPLLWTTTYTSLRAVSLKRFRFLQTNDMLPFRVWVSVYDVKIFILTVSAKLLGIWNLSYAHVLPPLALISTQHNCLIRCI